ncbi:MFS transporter [Chloroflexota bacterium]
MKDKLLLKSKGLGNIYSQWGGTTPIIFAYAHAGHDMCIGLLVGLLPFISVDLGLSYLQAGFLLSAYALTAGFSQLLGGWIGDRVSKHMVIAIGLAGIGLSTFTIGFSPSFYPMLTMLVIMGVFAGAYHPSATAMISNHFSGSIMGRVISIHLLGGSIGHTIGPILGGFIANAIGWRFAYILLSIPVLLAVFVSLTIFRKLEQTSLSEVKTIAPAINSNITEETPERLSLLQAIRPIVDILVLVTLTQLVVGSITSFLPLYLVDKYGIAPVYASMLMGIFRGVGIAGNLLGGWISDKWGRINAIAIALAVIGPIFFLCTIAPNNIVLILSFATFGLFIQMRQPTVQPYLMDRTPKYLRATIIGIYFGVGMEGRSFLQPVIGYITDTYGVIDVFQVLAFITIVLSLLALLIIKRPKLSR